MWQSMIRKLKTVDEVIDRLGGTGAVARITRRRPQAVTNWRKRGLPRKTFLILSAELRKARLSAPAELWGFSEAG